MACHRTLCFVSPCFVRILSLPLRCLHSVSPRALSAFCFSPCVVYILSLPLHCFHSVLQVTGGSGSLSLSFVSKEEVSRVAAAIVSVVERLGASMQQLQRAGKWKHPGVYPRLPHEVLRVQVKAEFSMKPLLVVRYRITLLHGSSNRQACDLNNLYCPYLPLSLLTPLPSLSSPSSFSQPVFTLKLNK